MDKLKMLESKRLFLVSAKQYARAFDCDECKKKLEDKLKKVNKEIGKLKTND
jgi:hypothetical protein